MSTTSFVTKELDSLRARSTDAPILDNEYWALCRAALGAKDIMPKDEIVRRVAMLADEVLGHRANKLTAIPVLGHLKHPDGDEIEINVKMVLYGVPEDHAMAIKDELADSARSHMKSIKARYERA